MRLRNREWLNGLIVAVLVVFGTVALRGAELRE